VNIQAPSSLVAPSFSNNEPKMRKDTDMTLGTLNGNGTAKGDNQPFSPHLDALQSLREVKDPEDKDDTEEGTKALDEEGETQETEGSSGAEEDDFPLKADGRPVIDVTKPFDKIVDRSVRELAKEPTLFQKRSELVRVVMEEGGRVRIRPFKSVVLRYVLSQKAHWVKGTDPVHPPDHVARGIVERTAWERIRILRAVTPFPAIDPDGQMPKEPGYDKSTETYFTGAVDVHVPDQPSQDDARAAVAVLYDIVQDFPFANEEHKAAWLAGLLTPLARYAHDGNAPMILVQANGPRIGKTTLVKLISHIVFGTDSPVMTFTKNEDETRKRILSFLRVARSMVLVDNVVGQFGGQNVNALVTSRNFEDRILGKSVILETLNDTSWFVTGNNIQLAQDTAERCVNVRLQSSEEKPHLRTDFKYPNLFETVSERRGELLSAALTVLKAFIVAGKPDQQLAAWGGFEAWSRLIRGAIVFAGMPDPANTRLELEEQTDVETDEKAALIVGLDEWQTANGINVAMKASEILQHVREHRDQSSKLRMALEDIAGSPGSLPDSKTLGRHLREAWNRNFGGLVLRKEPDAKSAHGWRVERLGEPHPIAEEEGQAA